MKRTLAAVALAMFGVGMAGPAHAAPPTSGFVSGWGTRPGFAFGGEVKIATDGTTVGEFTIVMDIDPTHHVSCRYHDFYRGQVSGNLATFMAKGSCIGPSGPFTSFNNFGIADNGSPGAGLDKIDVNYFGATGIAIPGGLLVTGDLEVHP
jgi:hypothetical protein